MDQDFQPIRTHFWQAKMDQANQLCHLTQHIKTKFVRKEKIITPNMKEHSKDNGIIGNKDGISGF